MNLVPTQALLPRTKFNKLKVGACFVISDGAIDGAPTLVKIDNNHYSYLAENEPQFKPVGAVPADNGQPLFYSKPAIKVSSTGVNVVQINNQDSRPTALFFSGDPGLTITPGDPAFPIDGSNYELAATGADNGASVKLDWTVPIFPLLVRGGLILQRSTTAFNNPLSPNFTGLVSALIPQPVPDLNWTIVAHWESIANLSLFLKTWTDPLPANQPCAIYRLIAFTAGPTGASYLEVDWNIVSITRTYLLTGTSAGGNVTLDWSGAQGDPVNPVGALYTGFTIEHSSSPGVWAMLYGPGGTFPSLAGTLRNKSGLPMATQYRVKGILSNGLVVGHNDVTIGTGTGIPRAQIQRMFGGKTGSSGSGITANKMAVDSAGNVVIIGQMLYTVNPGNGDMTTYGGQDAIIAKYSPGGQCLWAKHYGNVSDDVFHSVCIDSQDNIYAIGQVSGPVFAGNIDFGFGTEQAYGGADILLAKFSPSGAVLWHRIFGGSGGDDGTAIARDANDDIYIAGTHGFFGTGVNFGGGVLATPGRPSAFLAKFHGSDGSYMWAKSYGDGSNGSYPTDLIIASDGAPVVIAKFLGSTNFGTGVITSAGDYDSIIAKCNASTGATTWVKAITGTRLIVAYAIAASTGNIFVVGDFLGTASFNGHTLTADDGGSFFLAQYNNAGDWVRFTAFGTPNNSPHVAGVAASDSLGVVVVGEMVTGIDFGQGYLIGQGGNDIMLLRFNSDLTTQWSRRGAPSGEGGRAVVVAGGNIYLAGGCGSATGLTGFERNTGFGQTTIDAAVSVVTTSGVDSTAWWVKFSP